MHSALPSSPFFTDALLTKTRIAHIMVWQSENLAVNGKVTGMRKERERRPPAESCLADASGEVHPGAVRMNADVCDNPGRSRAVTAL